MNKKQISKRNRFFTWTWQGCLLLGAAGFLTTSCASDGFTDESFVSGNGVTNTQLVSPSVDDITITPSADGSKQTIAWPVVNGAGGYQAILTNLTTEEVMVDSIIDGLSFIVDREEDTNYQLNIMVLGNEKLGNTAREVTTKLFDTFSPTFGTIDEDDIYEYFQKNPLPTEPTGKELCFDLTPGGNYTLSKTVDFGGHRVTLRSKSKTEHAKITLEEGSTFSSFAGMSLKYLDIDADNTSYSVITMSEEPNDSIKDKIETKGWYFVYEPITIQGCNIRSLGTSLIATKTVKYNLRSVTVTDCVIEINGNATKKNSNAFIYMNAGYITDFIVKNSTIYSKEHNEKFFIQHKNRPADLNKTELRNVTITNCTLANLAWNKNFCDYHNGQTTQSYTLLNSIILDCGKVNFVTGLNKGQSSANPTWNIDNNTYWREGQDVSESQTGYTNNKGADTKLTTDPEIDPATEDFVPATAQQEAKQGDPHWYTTE